MFQISLKTAALAAALAVAAAGLPSVQAAERLNLYTAQSSPQIVISRGLKRMADEVEKATNGELTIRIHQAGTLQIETSNITGAVSQNIVQMGDDLLFTGNVPLGGIQRLPFLVRSDEQAASTAKALAPFVEKEYASRGITVLASYVSPPQYVWGKEAVAKLDDLKGMKLRVSSPEQGEFVKRAGGIPITISVPETAGALDRGMVDGVLTAGVGGGILWKDSLAHGYLLPVNYNNAHIIINTKVFEGLSPEVQKTLRQAATDAGQWIATNFKSEDDAVIKEIAAGKFTITEPTAEDIERAAKLMADYWDVWAKDRGPAAQEALAAVRSAAGI